MGILNKKPSNVTKTDTGFDVDFGDDGGIIAVHSSQAANEKEALKVATAAQEDAKANLEKLNSN